MQPLKTSAIVVSLDSCCYLWIIFSRFVISNGILVT